MTTKIDFVKHKAVLPVEFLSVLFTILGLFLRIWWSSGHSPETLQHYDLWERVDCTYGICQRTNGDSSGFLIFTRFSGILSLFLTSTALLSTLLYLWRQKRYFNYITGLLSICNGWITFLMSMVLIGEFHVISDAWDSARVSVLIPTSRLLRYNPVAIFFLLFSGLASVGTAILTLVRFDDNPKLKGSNSSKSNREAITRASMIKC